MKLAYALTVVFALVELAGHAAIGNDAAYKSAGDSFRPFFDLGNQSRYFCVGYLKKGGSAVWIGGRWALTVGHAVNPADGNDKGNAMVITTRAETLEIPVVEVCRPEKLIERDHYGPDIAIIKLASVPHGFGLSRATVSAREDVLGMEGEYSGYGTLGLGSTGPDAARFKRTHPGLRFGFQNKLDHYSNGNFVVRSIFDESGLPLEGCGSGGDSGSGLFANIDGSWKLIGINAHSDVGPGGRFYQKSPVYGSTTGSVRVALFYPEIQKVLNENDPAAFASLTWEEMQKRIERTKPDRQ
jgi:hypothetical protein